MKFAVRLLMLSLHHPATLPETKARAEQLVAEYKVKLTSEEVEAAQYSSADSLEAVVRDILAHRGSRKDRSMPEHGHSNPA